MDKEKIKINKSEGEKFAKENKIKFYEISAKEDTNVRNMFLSSIAQLPFFDSYRNINDKDNKQIIEDLDNENNDLGGGTIGLGQGDTSRINISISPDNFSDPDRKCKC